MSTIMLCWFSLNLPSFNSPKFPQPIFLPTRKFGPTMRTPEELEEPDGRDECPLRLPWETLAALVGRSPYLSLSLCWSMVWAAQVSGSQEWCTIRPPGPGPPQPQPWSLAVPGGHSHSHETKPDTALAATPPCPHPVTSNNCWTGWSLFSTFVTGTRRWMTWNKQ